jgi:hypothetical protein
MAVLEKKNKYNSATFVPYYDPLLEEDTLEQLENAPKVRD